MLVLVFECKYSCVHKYNINCSIQWHPLLRASTSFESVVFHGLQFSHRYECTVGLPFSTQNKKTYIEHIWLASLVLNRTIQKFCLSHRSQYYALNQSVGFMIPTYEHTEHTLSLWRSWPLNEHEPNGYAFVWV